MAITRVLDQRGAVVHDCIASGCEVSWDGFALTDNVTVPAHTDAQGHDVAESKARKNDRMPNAADPDPNLYVVNGQTARLRADKG